MNKSDSDTVRGSRRFVICLCGLVLFSLFSNSLSAAPDRSFFDQLLDSSKQAFNKGNYTLAETELRQAVAVAGANGDSGAQMSLAVGNLGSALLSQGRYAEAETSFVRAIAILKSSGSADKRQLPVLLGNLGKLYQQSGRYKLAESVLREALKVGAQLFADSPMYMADLHNSLGVVHFAMGNKKQAERDLRKAVALANEASDGNPGRTSILSNLATLYFMQQKWSLAEESLLGSIKAVELSSGTDHPDLCPLLEHVGHVRGRTLLAASLCSPPDVRHSGRVCNVRRRATPRPPQHRRLTKEHVPPSVGWPHTKRSG